jgi:hypothetical protein
MGRQSRTEWLRLENGAPGYISTSHSYKSHVGRDVAVGLICIGDVRRATRFDLAALGLRLKRRGLPVTTAPASGMPPTAPAVDAAAAVKTATTTVETSAATCTTLYGAAAVESAAATAAGAWSSASTTAAVPTAAVPTAATIVATAIPVAIPAAVKAITIEVAVSVETTAIEAAAVKTTPVEAEAERIESTKTEAAIGITAEAHAVSVPSPVSVSSLPVSSSVPVAAGVIGIVRVIRGTDLRGVRNEVGTSLEGIESKCLYARADQDNRMIFLYFDRFLVCFGAGVGKGLTLEDADRVGIGVEGVEAIFDEGGLASGEVDEDLCVSYGLVDADVGDAVLHAEFGILGVDGDGAHRAVVADTNKDAGVGLRADRAGCWGQSLTCG